MVIRHWVGARLGEHLKAASGNSFSRAATSALRRASSYIGHRRRHHCAISGTGRAGTSFLVQILTKLQLDTGFTPDNLPLFRSARAGLETDLRDEHAPYIVKDPALCDYIEDILKRPDIVIDHAIIPMRSIAAAAQSRIHVERVSEPGHTTRNTPGGLWGTRREDEQERILQEKFYALLWPLVRHGVPITFLAYPRLVKDPRYLFDQLDFLLKRISFGDFQNAWREVVKPEWVHQFGDDELSAQSGSASVKAIPRQMQ